MSESELNFRQQATIHMNIERVQKLIDTGILNDYNNMFENVFFKSVIIEIFIIMRDLTKKSEIFSKRVSFSDDVRRDEGLDIYDVTDLIRVFRDCFCHIETGKKNIDSATFDFNIVPYDDGDYAIQMGANKIFIKKHLFRALEELKVNFSYKSIE